MCKPINCLVNWKKTCALKENGGLGIMDLKTQNDALLTKWIWICHSDSRVIGPQDLSEEPLQQRFSFFLKDLQQLAPFYKVSTKQDTNSLQLMWRWEASGRFTTASTYRMLHNTGMICGYQKRLWKIRAPPKVKVFLWVLLQNKLLTKGVLLRRGCQVPGDCVLCGDTVTETDVHLFWECDYTAIYWRMLLTSYNDRRPINARSHVQLWIAIARQLDEVGRRTWNTVWSAGLWALWRERNNRIFSLRSKSQEILTRETRGDIGQWINNS